MNFSDTASSWIWAFRDGPAIASTSQTVNLQIHTANAGFTLDLTKGAGGNSLDPFTDTAVNSSSSTSGSSSSGGGGGGGGPSKSGHQKTLAHGFLMSLAFLYAILPVRVPLQR